MKYSVLVIVLCLIHLCSSHHSNPSEHSDRSDHSGPSHCHYCNEKKVLRCVGYSNVAAMMHELRSELKKSGVIQADDLSLDNKTMVSDTELNLGMFDLSGIKGLSLMEDGITSFAEQWITETDSLERLNLNGNRLVSIDSNPFKGLRNLKTLSLVGCGIESMSPGAFSDLISLKHLDLRNNRIDMMPENLFHEMSALEVLDLSQNMISLLHIHLFQNSMNLVNLNMSHNYIAFISEMIIANFTSLEYLDLRDNNLVSLSPTASALCSIKHVFLTNNKWLCNPRLNWMKECPPSDNENDFQDVKCWNPPSLRDTRVMDANLKGTQRTFLGLPHNSQS